MNQPAGQMHATRLRPRIGRYCAGLLTVLTLAGCMLPAGAYASTKVSTPKKTSTTEESTGGLQLEKAAAAAGNTGRKVAVSLIGLAFAIAAIVLAFRRDFKEAAGVLLIGVIAIFLANQTGVNVLTETVEKLFT
jgi:hypothetical protein